MEIAVESNRSACSNGYNDAQPKQCPKRRR
jgi:hypothetical protein